MSQFALRKVLLRYKIWTGSKAMCCVYLYWVELLTVCILRMDKYCSNFYVMDLSLDATWQCIQCAWALLLPTMRNGLSRMGTGTFCPLYYSERVNNPTSCMTSTTVKQILHGQITSTN